VILCFVGVFGTLLCVGDDSLLCILITASRNSGCVPPRFCPFCLTPSCCFSVLHWPSPAVLPPPGLSGCLGSHRHWLWSVNGWTIPATATSLSCSLIRPTACEDKMPVFFLRCSLYYPSLVCLSYPTSHSHPCPY
jgi:hypothetical protein